MRDHYSTPPSVVVGIDGSRSALDAALWAVNEAVSRDIPLRLVYAIDPDTDLAEASRYLEATANTLRAEGLQVSIKTANEPAIPLIQSLARPASTDILAFATHGRGGISRLLFGSVAAAVLARTTVPVFLVKPAELRTTQPHA